MFWAFSRPTKPLAFFSFLRNIFTVRAVHWLELGTAFQARKGLDSFAVADITVTVENYYNYNN